MVGGKVRNMKLFYQRTGAEGSGSGQRRGRGCPKGSGQGSGSGQTSGTKIWSYADL